MEREEVYDLVIVGAGVSGAAQFFATAKYTDINRVLLIEKESAAGLINSRATNNSQTLHEGDIETNYTLEKATVVKRKAGFTRAYVEQKDDESLTLRGPKMVLGVGERECAVLDERFVSFQDLFPTLERLETAALKEKEPNIFKGRSGSEEVRALYNPDGLTIDYGKLAGELVGDGVRSFGEDAHRDGQVQFSTSVDSIEKTTEGYVLHLGDGNVVHTRYLSFCTGSHSMYFAKKMGIEEVQDVSLLCVAGNFYYTPKYVDAKIYTVQNPKLPFAAVHADPDILHPEKNRFGPTTRIVFMLERHRWHTLPEYLATMRPMMRSLLAYIRILTDRSFLAYAFRHNVLFFIPYVGNYLYLTEVRKIIPSVRYGDVARARGQGGVRPQIVATQHNDPLNLGEAKFTGERVRFNVTPSPGASTCLYNGLVDIQAIATELGSQFYVSRVEEDFGHALST